jgi:hypothetical protein
MTLLDAYVRELRLIRSSGAGVPETSYYVPLAELLNAIGQTLRPRVRCIMTLKDQGAGLPDGGLFTADQFRKGEGEPLPGQLPARGAIEVKSVGEDAWLTADSGQVSRYWERYRQVLVTNYRDFVFVGQDGEGRPVKRESFRLAESEAAFWVAAAHPEKLARERGASFEEFLKRVMLHAAPLATPRDVAWLLASYAREARARVEAAAPDALAPVRKALEEGLGIQFQGRKGEHFFRSTLVQTLFYGIFSAWVLWSKQHPGAPAAATFSWQTAAHYLRVPVLRKLFHEIAEPGQLEALKLPEVLDWAGDVLNRVDRSAFFARFEEEHAVQYFYEPFLEAYDPELRKELGVWYTPPEIVRYMVGRVDAALREELGIEDGLADPRVYVLDPCCGTGAYLVEVLNRVAAVLQERDGDALLAADLKAAAMSRVFGFEILPAPFVVAHLQLGLLLQKLGAPLAAERNERARVYLTNALTGWEPPREPKQHFLFPEFEAERDAAARVKQVEPILVVLGNPPYNGFAGVAVEEERALSDAYRTARLAPAPQGQGLNDLYVRFFRMAERRIAEETKKGVVCLISNYSWLDGLSFTGMRERYLQAFDSIWIDCLNGDKYKTGKLTPEGEPDPSVFSSEMNPEGIQVGTAIALLVRRDPHGGQPAVRFRHLWGKGKRAQLAEEAAGRWDEAGYTRLAPEADLGFPYVPLRFDRDYPGWPALPDLFPVSFPGVKTSRDDVVVDIDRERLIRRMEQYFDPGVSHEEMRRIAPGAMATTARFQAEAVRDRLRKRGFLPEKVVRYCYRPFDLRWLYWEPEAGLLDRSRAEYFPHVVPGNRWLVTQQKPRRGWSKPQVISSLGCIDLMDRSASVIPSHLVDANTTLFGRIRADAAASGTSDLQPNVTELAVGYLGSIKAGDCADDLFYHAVAMLHAPLYLGDNAGALGQDWPRLPLPADREALLASAALGRRVADLLDPERPVPGVTAGTIRPELRLLGRVTRVGGGNLDPSAGDLELTAGWGYAGQGGVTMPGQGRVAERGYAPEEVVALREGAGTLGLSLEELLGLLGESTLDVYLNPVACWQNVPVRVWEYTLGGYQVVKKWLSYRERRLLGRALTVEEVREVTAMVRRIAAILLLGPELDASYRRVKDGCYGWPGPGTGG